MILNGKNIKMSNIEIKKMSKVVEWDRRYRMVFVGKN
jgi:hypothetical protein